MWKNSESNKVISQKMKVKPYVYRSFPIRSISTVLDASSQESKYNSLGNHLSLCLKDSTNTINVQQILHSCFQLN